MGQRKILCVVWIAVLLFVGFSGIAGGAEAEKVVIYRDDFGVPHIFADTNWGVFYGAGYAIAQDRLNQIHQFRLLAEGRLAEVAGVDYFASDCQLRRDLGGLNKAKMAFSRMGSPYRDWLQAYSAGINRFITESRLEGIIDPWTPADTLAIERYVVWMFSQGKSAELERMATLNFLVERFGKEKAKLMWRDLMSPTDPDAITTIPGPANVLQINQTRANPELDTLKSASSDSLFQGAFSRSWLGSNSIVVSPERSATGKPLLVSNTQLEVHFPSVYYEQHLHGGDFDVIGFTMPGFPPVGFGHNANMAWTITVGCSNQQDVYEETIRMGPENKLQYSFKGQWLDCATREEKIVVKGYLEPMVLKVVSTIHGPLEMLDLETGKAYATRWGPYLDGHTLISFFEMNRSKTIDDFAQGLSKVEMSFNFLYADTDGNIAYWHAGELPQRVDEHSGVLPVSGTGDFEWKGFVPFEQLPRLINPKEHIILLENNKPAFDSPDYDGSLTGWGTQRIQRIKQLAEKLPEKVTMADLEKILEDPRYLTADRLKPHLLRICRKQNGARFHQAAELLEKWDNTISGDSAATTIFFVWLQRLGRNMFMDEFGEHCLPPLIEKPHLPLILHAFERRRALSPPSADYFDDIETREPESKDEIIAKSLADALDECERYFGTPRMELWHWGEFSYWDLGPLGRVPNTYMDPNLHHLDVIGGGASSELIEVEADFPNARNLMPPGNSGDLESPHSSDQVELFVNFNYKPMLFDPRQIREEAVSKTVLECKPSRQ